MKTITIRQLASIKRTAQNVYPMVARKAKIANKIKELGEEFALLNDQIKGWEGAVISMTGGHTSEEMVTRTITPAVNEDGTPKLDINGKQQMITKYEPSSLLTFNEEKKVYCINEPSAEEPQAEEVAQETNVDEDLFN